MDRLELDEWYFLENQWVNYTEKAKLLYSFPWKSNILPLEVMTQFYRDGYFLHLWIKLIKML